MDQPMRQTVLIAILLLAACAGERAAEPTAEQAGQLNEAEAMLNQMNESERD
jgi:hypothetical protein